MSSVLLQEYAPSSFSYHFLYYHIMSRAMQAGSKFFCADSHSKYNFSYFRRGTIRTGSLMRVLPSGLASCRSRAVNAAITSGASNALFRRPTFTCRRIPTSTRRSIAAAAGLYVRPRSIAALSAVRIGAPGSIRSRISVPELARTDPSRSRHSSSNSAARSSYVVASATDLVQALAKRPIHVLRPSMAEREVGDPTYRNRVSPSM